MMSCSDEPVGSHCIETLNDPTVSIVSNNNNGQALAEVAVVKVTAGVKCATWSENPAHADWEVVLQLNSKTPQDLKERIGFAVVSTVGDKNQLSDEGMKNNNKKLHSLHDYMDLPSFTQLLNNGENFTQLELAGDFFNNVFLSPENVTNVNGGGSGTYAGELITLPNLKTLCVKAKLSICLKGFDEVAQHKYYTLHRQYCNTFKARAAKNLSFIFNAFECPILSKLEIMDCMEWDDPELKNNGFYYWDQPLISFLQRHASSLQSFKTSPIIAMPLLMGSQPHGHFDVNEGIPVVEDFLFWMKLRLEDLTKIQENQREIAYQIEVEKLLRKWRHFLEAQNNLKTLIWVSDAECPWTLMRRDFVNLAHQNSSLETVMVAMHGDSTFRRSHGLVSDSEQPITPPGGRGGGGGGGTFSNKDYQIDAAIVHGMTSLHLLSIGCYEKDPQAKNFTLFNLHLLPGTLDTIQFFGIRVMASELESLAKLPKLRSLTLVQGGKITFTKEDELNGNIEGVTASVLKALIMNVRSLDNLVIVGFPISAEVAAGMSSVGRKTSNSVPPSTGWFGGLCSGAMCMPNIESENSLETRELSSLSQYPEPLRELIAVFASSGGSVSDVASENNKEQLMTMLKMG